MSDSETLGERLRHAIKCSPITLGEIAKEAGVTTQAIHQAIKKNAMKEENLKKIALIIEVDADWII